jgi:DNA-directed RNA polymerase specialized sigma54-like protein
MSSMRQEQRPQQRAEQTLRVSPRLITSSNILHFSAEELEHAIYQEQLDNAAIEVKERRHAALWFEWANMQQLWPRTTVFSIKRLIRRKRWAAIGIPSTGIFRYRQLRSRSS